MKSKRLIRSGTLYIVLVFLSLLFLAPFFWMVTTALKSPDELYMFPPKWFPSSWQFENFGKAWNSQPFNTFLMNSVIVTFLTTLGQIVSSTLIAYGFARFKFKGRDFLFMVLLATMMIPWEVTMIPQYMEFNYFGWINTLKPLIVPAWFGAPFYIFLLRQFIMSIPKELDEAARMDGANSFQIYYRIHLPLMWPIIVLIGVFNFLSSWNDYLGPLIFLNDQSKYTLTLGLAQFNGMYDVNMEGIMAVTFLISLPPLILFFFAQKYIVNGVSSTGFK
ncbi:carbohydrate ABC transporter permease [Cytobacillus sp. NJ13]|uniref:Sugar ABC transporter permease n=1 Tax=Sporosarcina globispora TaxID=1459 RepID=A0A0M0GDH1_SPOGL|nr:carbohydrate ABC transporter permease [Sporosarcina globispora]KON87823.1 sugar ABC transporter permease [Sporosarcina globispora]MDM5224860.1 carbohydrate ABC transporter permease [Cytobacillus sp. NJ13]